MGLSITSSNSLCSCFLVRNLDPKGWTKFVSFDGNYGDKLNFSTANVASKAQSKRSLRCNLESIDFEERTSPSGFFSARKHGLVDAAVRATGSDKTAIVALPGGIGTLDEAFEILALIQLERIGSLLPVPFLLMNYDSFYSKLLDFLGDCEVWGTVSCSEVASLWKVCNSNSEALTYLTQFYGILQNDVGRSSSSGLIYDCKAPSS